MKIDFTKIEGYSEMSTEEKLNAIESFEFNLVDKKVFDNKASEAAKYSRELKETKAQLNDRLSDDEKLQEERRIEKEQQEQLKANYENLLKENKMTKAKSEYIAMGMDSELATATAKAFVDGDEATIFENQKKFIELKEKSIRAEMLNNQQTLTNGKPLTQEEKEVMENKALRGYFGL